MAIDFNHTILRARQSEQSATFLAAMLGLPPPRRWGPFQMVTTDNGANLTTWMLTATSRPALRVPGRRRRVRPDLREDSRARTRVLGRPRQGTAVRHQKSSRRRPRPVFRGSQR